MKKVKKMMKHEIKVYKHEVEDNHKYLIGVDISLLHQLDESRVNFSYCVIDRTSVPYTVVLSEGFIIEGTRFQIEEEINIKCDLLARTFNNCRVIIER